MTFNLDIDQLRAFTTVAHSGSFTRTGELLGRSQSAISLQIKRLETSIERQLFTRNGRIILLTDEGERFLVEAERILEMHDRAVALLSQTPVSGRVSLGCTEEYAAVFLSDVLGSFQRTHPNVHIEINVEASGELRNGFQSRRYDIALAKIAKEENGGGGRMLWRENLLWVIDSRTEPEHLLKRIPLPLLASPVPCTIRRAMTIALDQAGIKWAVIGTSEVNAGLQAAVRAGFGISALPASATDKSMRVLGPDDGLPELPSSDVYLFENPDDGNAAARCMTDHIVRRMAPSGIYG